MGHRRCLRTKLAAAEPWAAVGDTSLKLRDRRKEHQALDELIGAVRAGGGRALVVHGEAGVGKTALLECLQDETRDWTVVRASGVESEKELAFAGLHQLCTPLLDHLGRLPDPQQRALRTALGLTVGDP